MREGVENHVGREGVEVLAGTFGEGMGECGCTDPGLQRGKESTLVRRGDERDVPGWVRGNEGANKSDIKACLLWGSTVGKKAL